MSANVKPSPGGQYTWEGELSSDQYQPEVAQRPESKANGLEVAG
jgi:hypothetical protein